MDISMQDFGIFLLVKFWGTTDGTLLLTYLHRMGRTGNRTPCHRLTDSREVSATVLPVSTISLQWVYFHWIVLKNTTGMWKLQLNQENPNPPHSNIYTLVAYHLPIHPSPMLSLPDWVLARRNWFWQFHSRAQQSVCRRAGMKRITTVKNSGNFCGEPWWHWRNLNLPFSLLPEEQTASTKLAAF